MFCTLALGASAEADVELDPAVIQGNFALTGSTVQSVYAYVYASNGFYGTGTFQGSSFELTVEGGHDYRRNVEANVSRSGSSSYLQVSRSSTISAPVGDTVQDDYSYDAGAISGTVTVLGGKLSSYQLYASASTSTETYSARHYDTGSNASADSFSFPMVPDDSVRVYGTATVITDSGLQLTRPLDELTISGFTSAGATADFSIDLTNLDTTTGSLSGLISLGPVNGLDVVFQHQVLAYGVSSTATQGLYLNKTRQDNGQYLFDKLVPGSYDVYGVSYFDAPYGYLYHPYGTGTNPARRSVAAGATTTRDFAGELGVMGGTLTPHGFVEPADLASATVSAIGFNGTVTNSGSANDTISSDGSFALAVLEGSWVPWTYTARVYDTSEPSHPINAYFSSYEYSRQPTYGGTALDVQAGATVTVPGFSPNIAEATITFDVNEQPGAPEIDISSAYVSGYRYVYKESGQFDRIVSIQAYGPTQAQPTPALRVVGEPGVYTMTAYATVNGTNTTFATFQFELEEPQSTPAGINVTVSPSGNVQVTFSTVTHGGVTTATELPIGPEAPEGYGLLSPGGDPAYWDIATTATYSGPIRVCITYPELDDNGEPLWAPPSAEGQLRLAQYDASTASWSDITLASYPDVGSNVICGETTSLSSFAILIPQDPDLDGVIGSDDNCPEDANADQLDLDADGQGDVCDEDDDGDGVPDDVDNCPTLSGADQSDLDGDGMGDACDSDDDGDAVDDDLDNCPLLPNGGQSDFDLDGLGDACDDDDDGDGVLDGVDACGSTPVGVAVDTSGCSSAQRVATACPTTGSYRNAGVYIQCVAREATAQVALGLITQAEKDALVAQAAQSGIGAR
ncbi:MAG TPA: thrombospondin type 3 repeat-containing protein [Polyangiaceae bacterium]|nr:thrombospondin type 3 repeat-containing protein [Polyangiaceae bacterium]